MSSEGTNNKNGASTGTDSFGAKIRQFRYQKGIGIKKLALQLGVDYSYLSKIENGKVPASAGIVERLSEYFDCNRDELMLLADKVPRDVMQILRENPQEALALLRESFPTNGQGL
jgi:transcriptional regulator with XRE-family HTH domain